MKQSVYKSAVGVALLALLSGCASSYTVYDTEEGWFPEREEGVPPECRPATVDFALTSSLGPVGAFVVDKAVRDVNRGTGRCIEPEYHPDNQ